VLEVFAANATRLRALVEKIIEGLPSGRDCPCPDTLDGIKLPFQLPG
jgi:5'-methylthioadenosine phosphorylase